MISSIETCSCRIFRLFCLSIEVLIFLPAHLSLYFVALFFEELYTINKHRRDVRFV